MSDFQTVRRVGVRILAECGVCTSLKTRMIDSLDIKFSVGVNVNCYFPATAGGIQPLAGDPK